MRDIKLDSNGDLAVQGFDLAFVAGADQVAQRLRTRLRSFLGEWYLDADYGIPYIEEVLVKDPDLGRITAILGDAVLADAEVTEIVSYTVEYREPRSLFYRFECRTVYGEETISIEGASP